MLLSLLALSKSSAVFNWNGNWDGKGEAARWDPQGLHATKRCQIVEMWECEWWSLYKTDVSVKSHLRENSPHKRLLSEERVLQVIFDGRLSGYIQCDIEVPQHLRRYFSNFPTIFKKIVVSKEHIGTLMKEYAEKENIMVQHRKMLISSFHLTIGTLITLSFLFYLKLELVCKKIHRFVQYIPKKCSDTVVFRECTTSRWKIQTRVLLPRLWNC